MHARRGAAVVVAVAVAGSVTAWTGTAAAARPEWAGPPQVERTALVEDPVSFQCGERHLTFIAGELVTRSRMLPGGRYRDIRRPVGGQLVDEEGNVYRVHGSAGVRLDSEGNELFRLTGAIVGPAGMTDTVNTRIRFEADAPPDVTERGTCTLVFG